MKALLDTAPYDNEKNLLDALRPEFLAAYPMLSPENLEMLLNDRLWAFKSEIREELLKRSDDEKKIYLHEVFNGFQTLNEQSLKATRISTQNLNIDLLLIQHKYLLLTLTYLGEQMNLHGETASFNKKKINVLPEKPFISFEFSQATADVLIYFYTAVQDQLNAFDAAFTPGEMFAEILTHPNLNALPREKGIHFACGSVCAAHCLRAIKPLFANFSYANVERSHRFYTANNTPFTARYIGNLLTKDFKERHLLDAIVAKF